MIMQRRSLWMKGTSPMAWRQKPAWQTGRHCEGHYGWTKVEENGGQTRAEI